MAKPSETFSKQELEKKRLKKQKDKKQRAEERKSSPGSGKSLEDMMAYVDEYGNITLTPPDPAKKLQVLPEDIQIGIPKKENLVAETIRTGTVAFFNESKGFGFIKDTQTQESIFVHVNGLIDPVKDNDKVTFETEQGHKGLNAIKVKKAGKV